jgi:NAD(P)H-flavin reductase
LKLIYTISEKNQQRKLTSLLYLTETNDWNGEYGRIDKAMILKYVNYKTLKDSLFYICGPPVMIKAMESLIQKELEIPKERIKVEEFIGY